MFNQAGNWRAMQVVIAGSHGFIGSTLVPHLRADGHHVTWRQTVTRPMRLNLEFDVTARGPTLVGHSRAGKLPRSTVTGTRRSPAGCDV